AQMERLGDIVVGPDLEAHHPVGDVAAAGQHDDRYVRTGADLAGEVNSVFAAGQHEIEQDHPNAAGAEGAPHRGTVGGRRHEVALVLEVTGQHLADTRIVVHHEDAIRLVPLEVSHR